MSLDLPLLINEDRFTTDRLFSYHGALDKNVKTQKTAHQSHGRCRLNRTEIIIIIIIIIIVVLNL